MKFIDEKWKVYFLDLEDHAKYQKIVLTIEGHKLLLFKESGLCFNSSGLLFVIVSIFYKLWKKHAARWMVRNNEAESTLWFEQPSSTDRKA